MRVYPSPGFQITHRMSNLNLTPSPSVLCRREVLTLRSVERMSIESALVANIPARVLMLTDLPFGAFRAPDEPFRLSLLRDRRRTSTASAEIILSDPQAAAVAAIDLSRLHVAPFDRSNFRSSHHQSQPFLSWSTFFVQASFFAMAPRVFSLNKAGHSPANCFSAKTH